MPIQIIDRSEDAPAGAAILTFRVCRAPDEKGGTIGYLETKATAGIPLGHVFGKRHLGIEEAFVDAASVAEVLGVEFLLVEDPDELFPPEHRPPLNKRDQH